CRGKLPIKTILRSRSLQPFGGDQNPPTLPYVKRKPGDPCGRPVYVRRYQGATPRVAPISLYRSRSECEYIDHGACICIFQRRRLGGLLPFWSGRDRYILLAVDRVADRRRHDAAARVEAPQLLQGLAVISDKRTLPESAEHKIAAGCKYARPVRQVGA